MEQDRRYREEQEQQLLALEEERRNYERLLRYVPFMHAYMYA
jgi:hypothetical protein